MLWNHKQCLDCARIYPVSLGVQNLELLINFVLFLILRPEVENTRTNCNNVVLPEVHMTSQVCQQQMRMKHRTCKETNISTTSYIIGITTMKMLLLLLWIVRPNIVWQTRVYFAELTDCLLNNLSRLTSDWRIKVMTVMIRFGRFPCQTVHMPIYNYKRLILMLFSSDLTFLYLYDWTLFVLCTDAELVTL